ncbi:MAG: hypothetical protein QOH61_1670 [Chloroflexota bacterium]|jgi:peptidoglycan/xylan/chitin deacetylase (PgdA/CDA1 family)|nr:hypothetical protein [Chloroflexota bacterium]
MTVRGRTVALLALAVVGALGMVGLAGAAAPVRASGGVHVPVLMYHHIACPPKGASDDLWTCPSTFRATLRLLKDKGWRAMTADRLAQRVAAHRSVPPQRLVISVDDAYDDAYLAAYPILRDLRLTATFYVITGAVGLAGQVTWDQLREMRAAGMDVANHTVTHPHLDEVTPEEQEAEIVGAQDTIDVEVGHRPRTLAYPFGDNDRSTRRAARNAGLTLAFTDDWGASESASRPFLCPRLYIDGSNTPKAVLAAVAPFA